MSETAAVVVRRAMSASERMKKFLEKAVDKVERMDGQEKQAFGVLRLRIGWGLVSLRLRNVDVEDGC